LLPNQSCQPIDGYKAAVAVDTDSQLITAVDVLPGNAPDNAEAMALVEQSKKNTACEAEETMGDCAYGDGATRHAFVNAGLILFKFCRTILIYERHVSREFWNNCSAASRWRSWTGSNSALAIASGTLRK